MNNILVAGSGLTVRPLCEHLLKMCDAKVAIAGPDAESIANNYDKKRISGHTMDADNLAPLSPLLKKTDVVVVPHSCDKLTDLGRLCINYGVNLVTGERLPRNALKLGTLVREKDLLFLFEVGLSPGMDHISAMTLMESLKRRDLKIISLESYCGNVPAPEANDNPLGFKFFENPALAMRAFKKPVWFKSQKKVVKLTEKHVFERHWLKDIDSLGHMEVFPYANSLFYQELYDLTEAETFILGVFRNPGWSESMDKVIQLGYMSDKKIPGNMSMVDLTAWLIRRKATGQFIRKLSKFLNIDPSSVILKRLEWLDLLSNASVPAGCSTPFQVLVTKMQEKMLYKKHERDLVLLNQEIIVEYPDLKREKFSVSLVEYGVPGIYKAAQELKGMMLSLAVQLVLKNIRPRGVQIPVVADIYNPIMQGLIDHNIQFSKKITRDV